MEAARRGAVAYGKLFSKKAGLVSRERHPDLANYRHDGYDFDARYEDGLAGYREKQIMDVLLREGPMLSKDLKRLAGSVSGGLKGFDTGIHRPQLRVRAGQAGQALRLGHRPLHRDGGRAGGGGDPRCLQPQPGGVQRADHPAPWAAVPRGVRQGFGKADPVTV